MFNMFGNIIRNLASKPATRIYPKERREPFANTRGHIGIDIEKCIFCGICAKKCPSNAIKVERKEMSWEIDYYICLICGACAEACPRKCINIKEDYLTSSYEKKKGLFIQAVKVLEPKEEGRAPENA
ncbi:MAG: 4Fe-4S dicluster domain-containing protein [Clostridiales bacterium]|nr:4Fe-4S dicluster domain-containing protein [Clostridiales bacterium]